MALSDSHPVSCEVSSKPNPTTKSIHSLSPTLRISYSSTREQQSTRREWSSLSHLWSTCRPSTSIAVANTEWPVISITWNTAPVLRSRTGQTSSNSCLSQESRDWEPFTGLSLLWIGHKIWMQVWYRSVEDIDLFVGGLSENRAFGSILGPTFGCLNGIQFHHWKYGDRFYFEHGGEAGSFTHGMISGR